MALVTIDASREWKVVAGRESPPDSARPAGNFHLLAQMKVTKAKCLNASDPSEELRPEGVAVGSRC